MDRFDQKPWHSLPYETIFLEAKTSESGLSEKEAFDRIKKFGKNELVKKASPSFFKMFCSQFTSPLIYILVLSMLMALFFHKYPDALVIGAVVFINTLIGAIQEYKSTRAIESLGEKVPSTCFVIRDGVKKKVDTSDVTIGDVIVLEAGERVCADARVFLVKNLSIDESVLTGESLPSDKRVDCVGVDDLIADRKNVVFSGTLVVTGQGYGVVFAKGMETEFGKIASMLSSVVNLKTPLSKALDDLAKKVVLFVAVLSLSVFLVAYLRGYEVLEAVLTGIALAVAAIPEGLPAIITIAAAVGVSRMAKKNSIMRHLEAVETLGSTSVICTDKTGTLTENKMQVSDIVYPDAKDYKEDMIKAAILCNTASRDKENPLLYHGDPTETALLKYAQEEGYDYEQIRHSFKRIDMIPFDTEKRWMASFHQDHNAKKNLFIKGAPEQILKKCSLSADALKTYEDVLYNMASEGLRVLAVAVKTLEPFRESCDESDVEKGFSLLGFFGMIDPPRQGVKESIELCYKAGVNIKMITGDHPQTAKKIAKEIGIKNPDEVITGDMLETLSEDELKKKVIRSSLFARTLPHHKLKIVQMLQSEGSVVAMTGDGVNDAPSLKQADIGVSMGLSGTSVAKEASDMILVDDNFTTIVKAVEEGRRVYDNLIKSILFIFPTNLAQALVILVGVFFFPDVDGKNVIPMLPVQVLWVNLITSVALALPLAFEVIEPGVMLRAPRNANRPVFTKELCMKTFFSGICMTLICVFVFYLEWKVFKKDFAQAQKLAQTSCVTTLVFMQIFYSFNCRTFKTSLFKIGLFSNRIFIIGVLIVTFLQLLFVYLPLSHVMFTSIALGWKSMVLCIGSALMFLPTLWFQKKLVEVNGKS